MVGAKGETGKFLLTQGLEAGDQKVEKEAPNVGDLIFVTLSLNGIDDYDFDVLQINSDHDESRFENQQRLQPCRPQDDPQLCSVTLVKNGDILFEVQLINGKEVKGPLSIALCGDNSNSGYKRITASGLQQNETVKRSVYCNNIGEIKGYKLKVEGDDNWQPISMIVRRMSDNKLWQFEHMIGVNSSQKKIEEFNCTSTSFEPFRSMTSPSTQHGQNSRVDEGNNEEAGCEKERNNYDINKIGGLIPDFEKQQIIDLECMETAENKTGSYDGSKFGPNYESSHLNAICLLARCPNHCFKYEGSIKGTGVHPFDSSICLSAMLDKTISPYGGIFRLCLIESPPKFEKPTIDPHFPNFHVYEDGKAQKAFTTSKIDNHTFSEKDFIVLDEKGQPSSTGLALIRINGVWGTICSIETDEFSASVFCRQVGFNGGRWLTNDKTKCNQIEGKDYCGAPSDSIFFYKVHCPFNASTLDQCQKSTPSSNCNHSEDSIVECYSNYNMSFMSGNTNFHPRTGDVRLNPSIIHNGATYGVAEMYTNNEWGKISDSKNRNTAIVICKTMGFATGDLTTNSTISNLVIQKLSVLNKEIKFACDNLNCVGNEHFAKQCEYSPGGVHTIRDVFLIKCSGGNQVDTTGKSQCMVEKPANTPRCGKLGIPGKVIDCSTRGNISEIDGDVGSAFRFMCPPGCANNGGAIYGTGIYTEDSNICKAAVHSGIINNNSGGWIVLTRAYGWKKFPGTIKNEVQSLQLEDERKAAFTLTRSCSAYANLMRLAAGDNSFIEKVQTFKLVTVDQDPLQISFIEGVSQTLQKMIPHSVFEYVPEKSDSEFDSNSSKDFHKSVKGMENFTFVAEILVNDKIEGNKKMIFSYNIVNELNIYINLEGRLSVQTQLEKYESSLVVPRNRMLQVYVKYVNGTLYLIVLDELAKLAFSDSKVITIKTTGTQLLAVGKLAGVDMHKFFGEINCLLLFEMEIDAFDATHYCKQIKQIQLMQSNDTVQKTTDNRICCSECYNNGRPGLPNAPAKPPQCSLTGTGSDEDRINPLTGELMPNDGRPVVDPLSSNSDFDMGPPPGCDGKYCPKEGGPNPENLTPGGPPSIQEGLCNVAVRDDPAFKTLAIDQRKTVDCTKCVGHSGLVYGSGPFSDLSNPCEAAYFAGILNENKSGEASHPMMIVVTVGKGIGTYLAGEGFNGLLSLELSGGLTKEGSGRSFTVMSAEPPISVRCNDTLNSSNFSSKTPDTKVCVTCPRECEKSTDAAVFGTQKYSDSSSICKAAIHNGSLNSVGGNVCFMIGGQILSSKGSELVAEEKSFDSGPSARHFFFLGEKSNIDGRFVEDGKGELTDKWTMQTASKVENKTSNAWGYENGTSAFQTGNRPSFGVVQSGQIKTSTPFEAATMLKNFQSNVINGIVHYSLLVPKQAKMGEQFFFFRMQDSNNLLGVKTNFLSTYANIEVFSKQAGIPKVICTYSYSLQTDVTYDFEIRMYMKQLKVRVKTPNSPIFNTVCEKNLDFISRGYVGMGVNNSPGVRFSNINLEENKGSEVNSFASESQIDLGFLVSKCKMHNRLKFCHKVMYELDIYRAKNCTRPDVYADLLCTSFISRHNKFSWYKCFKELLSDCTANNLNQVKTPSFQPRVDQKVDVQESVNPNNYFEGVVTNVSNKQGKIFANVSYRTMYGLQAEVNVPADGKAVAPCGAVLKNRKDCRQEDTQLTK